MGFRKNREEEILTTPSHLLRPSPYAPMVAEAVPPQKEEDLQEEEPVTPEAMEEKPSFSALKNALVELPSTPSLDGGGAPISPPTSPSEVSEEEKPNAPPPSKKSTKPTKTTKTKPTKIA